MQVARPFKSEPTKFWDELVLIQVKKAKSPCFSSLLGWPSL